MTKSGQRKALASTKINIPELLDDNVDEKFFKELNDIELKSYRGMLSFHYKLNDLETILMKSE